MSVGQAMMSVERYRDVLAAVKRHASNQGVEVTVDYSPTIESEPYVLSFAQVDAKGPGGVILIFPPTDMMLTSNEIAFIIQQINRVESVGGQALLVFSEETLALVNNVLKASGIFNHATAASYRRANGSYEMSWTLA
jgi:hypothetical protein